MEKLSLSWRLSNLVHELLYGRGKQLNGIHREATMTQPSANAVPSISIHQGHGKRSSAIGRIVLTLGLALAALGAWQTASACSPAPPQINIIQDDTPDCVVIDPSFDSSVNIENQCDGDLTVTIVEGGRQDGVERMALTIEQGDAAGIELVPETNQFEWSLADGSAGTILAELYYPETDCGDMLLGCDTMATRSDLLVSLCLVCVIGLAIRRRWQRTAA